MSMVKCCFVKASASLCDKHPIFQRSHIYLIFFFFFQAEDGIRDDLVTGVQTCALPILHFIHVLKFIIHFTSRDRNLMALQSELLGAHALGIRNILALTGDPLRVGDYRSEERRVGKECRSRWSPYH